MEDFRARGQKLSRRKEHFLPALAKHIVERCSEYEVGRIAIGDLRRIRAEESDRSQLAVRDDVIGKDEQRSRSR